MEGVLHVSQSLFARFETSSRAFHKQRKHFAHVHSKGSQVLDIWWVNLDAVIALTVDFTLRIDFISGWTQSILPVTVQGKERKKKIN